MWLFVHRPFEIIPFLATIRLELFYITALSIAWLCLGRISWMTNPLHFAFMSFALAVLICWLASPWSDTLKAQTIVEDYFKLIVFYVILVTTMRTEKDLKTICVGFVAIMMLYMLHSFREFLGGRHVYRMGIPRMIGVDNSLSDPNSFSASIVYALPMVAPCWELLRSARKAWTWLLVGYIALSILCVILTGSRGGLMTVILLILIYTIRSKYRVRIVALLLIAFPVVWAFIPPHLQTRFYTVIDPSVGPASARESAEGRSEGFWIGLALLEERSLTGCGPGAWIPATGRSVESHNLYGQVIGEMGVLGLISFLGVLLMIWSNIRFIKSAFKKYDWERDYLYYLADGVGVGVVTILFLGFGAHSLYRFNWLWYGAFLIVARHLIDSRIDAELDGQITGDTLT